MATTCGLVLVGFAIGSKGVTAAGVTAGWGPFLWGMVVWAIGLSLGGPTGYAINPARDLGPRLAHQILPIPNKGGSELELCGYSLFGACAGRCSRRTDLQKALVIGDGEALPEVLSVIRLAKESAGAGRPLGAAPGAAPGAARWSRQRLLEKLAGISGVYIPSFYSVEYNKEGRVQGFTALRPELQKLCAAALGADLNDIFFPTAPVVPLAEAVHERGNAGSLPWLHQGLPVLPGGDDLPAGAGA